MDAAATRWRATCCAAAATCVASGQAHFPHLPCTSPSSEQGLSLTLGLRVCLCVRVCVCAVRVRAAWVTQSGSELRVRVAGLLCSTPTIPAPPLATELLSEGPAPRRSSFYLFTVCSSSSLFLPTRLRPAATAFCSRTPVPLGGRSQVAAGHGAEDATRRARDTGYTDWPGAESVLRSEGSWGPPPRTLGACVGWQAAVGGGHAFLWERGPCLGGVTGGGEEWHPRAEGSAEEPCL